MASRSANKSLLNPLLILALIWFVWVLRYPLWHLLGFAEPLFLMLILSYLAVLAFAFCFIKKDARKSLSEVLKGHNVGVVPIAVVLAFVFQTVWFVFGMTIGGELDISSFLGLRGYEHYNIHSLAVAFVLYVVFAVFGAFVEEVTFRGYVQSRVASRHGHVIGVFTAALLFSLQHIHVFDLLWIAEFLQAQFIYVLLFGVFLGYLFLKSGEEIWGAFAFHALVNVFNISLPIKVTYTLPFSTQIVTIASFIFMIALLRLVAIDEIIRTG